jgi:hypothetical protein
MSAPFIAHVTRNHDELLDPAAFPGNLPFVPHLNLELRDAVTFFVGENGSGKSTLLEAIAVLSGFPICGGGTHDAGSFQALPEESRLADALRIGFRRRPKDGYFFRAELQSQFASLLDAQIRIRTSMGIPTAHSTVVVRSTACRTEKHSCPSCGTASAADCLSSTNRKRRCRPNGSTLLALMYSLARARQFAVPRRDTHRSCSPILKRFYSFRSTTRAAVC